MARVTITVPRDALFSIRHIVVNLRGDAWKGLTTLQAHGRGHNEATQTRTVAGKHEIKMEKRFWPNVPKALVDRVHAIEIAIGTALSDHVKADHKADSHTISMWIDGGAVEATLGGKAHAADIRSILASDGTDSLPARCSLVAEHGYPTPREVVSKLKTKLLTATANYLVALLDQEIDGPKYQTAE